MHRKLLKKKGVLYPVFYRSLFKKDKGHQYFSHAFSSQTDSAPISEGKLLAYSWTSKARRYNLDLLISAEPICRQTYSLKNCSWVQARQQYLERLAESLPPEQTRVILTLRRQDDFVQSLYKELVMKGVPPQAKISFEKFLGQTQKKSLRFYDNIMVFKKIFPDTQILTYDQLCNGDLPVNFFKALGITGLPNSGETVRKSLSNEEATLKQRLNDQIHSKDQNKKLLDWLKSDNTQRVIKTMIPTIYHFWDSNNERNKFLDKYSSENQKIKQNFFKDQTALFPHNQYSNYAPPENSQNLHDGIENAIEALSTGIKDLFGEDGLINIKRKLERTR
ncbi:hypothetical protein [Microbulbifer sp. A4B17]|uniref:hypothetical protein n=1 Tax=Microbulbifer sp. A4B17 TaxID=359370 RepID=UPI0013008FCE|nr:hypothetical protein [Microbulbifer sp. A4B17]